MRLSLTLLLLTTLATSAFALPPDATSNKVRAVQPIPETPFFGRIMDNLTGNPVVAADITNGLRSTTTDANGYFNMSLPANRNATLTITRTGYQTATVTVPVVESSSGVIVSPAVPAPPTPFTMTPMPVVTVKSTDGTSVTIDTDTFLFGYVLPFASPVTSQSAAVCGMDGTSYAPDRAEFARIVGPAVRTRNANCCTMGDVLGITAEMKSGERLQVTFSDSCAGYDMIVVGRNHVTAQPVSLNLATVSEILFP